VTPYWRGWRHPYLGYRKRFATMEGELTIWVWSFWVGPVEFRKAERGLGEGSGGAG
jgi:hypothetical protein